MARPQKLNVDYFPHYISNGKKMNLIRKRFGNDGYATWFILLEVIADADHHYLDLRDEIQVMYLSDRCNVSEQDLMNIIELLVKVKVFDVDMWNYKVLWSEKFNESVSDVWDRRNVSLMNKQQVKETLGILTKNSEQPINPEKKKKKEVVIPELEEFLEYCKEFLKEQYLGYEFSLIAKYNAWKANDWKDGFNNSIKNWKTKIQNTIPHLKKTNEGPSKNTRPSYQARSVDSERQDY